MSVLWTPCCGQIEWLNRKEKYKSESYFSRAMSLGKTADVTKFGQTDGQTVSTTSALAPLGASSPVVLNSRIDNRPN